MIAISFFTTQPSCCIYWDTITHFEGKTFFVQKAAKDCRRELNTISTTDPEDNNTKAKLHKCALNSWEQDALE